MTTTETTPTTDITVTPETSIVTTPAPYLYSVLVANKTGHSEHNLELDAAVNHLLELYKQHRMWITVNGSFFHPEAQFSDTPDDNRIAVKDRSRLRDLILGATISVEEEHAGVVSTVVKEAPAIAALPRLVGGGTKTATPKKRPARMSSRPSKSATVTGTTDASVKVTMTKKPGKLKLTMSLYRQMQACKLKKLSAKTFLRTAGYTNPEDVKSLMAQARSKSKQMQLA